MKKIYLPLILLLITLNCAVFGQSQGPHYPDSLWNNAAAGNSAWVNPANAKDSNAIYATVSLSTPATKRSDYLMATHFHFSIPANTRINGITVQVRGHIGASIGAFVTSYVKLIKNNVIQPDSINGGSLPYTNDVWQSFGGCSNMWNDTSLKYSDIDDSNFGAAYYGILLQYSNTAYIDAIRMTVCYTNLVGTEEFTQTSEGTIYPNPSRGRVYLNYKGKYNVQVYDNLMRLVADKWVTGQNREDLSYLKNGIYFVRITGEGFSDYKKIEIQK